MCRRLHSCWLTVVVAHEIDAAEGTAAGNLNNNSARANWWKTMEVGGDLSWMVELMMFM